MMDPRVEKLAQSLINFSCALKAGENILIQNQGGCGMLTRALVQEAYRAGGNPFVWNIDPAIQRALMLGCNGGQVDLMAQADGLLMKNMQAYIGIRGGDNAMESSDVPPERMALWAEHYSEPVHNRIRVPSTKWVVMRYPHPAMAQMAGMSTEAFEDYYFDVCCLDYGRMDRAMDPLKALMENTDRVHILGPGTDMRFSIKGIPAVKCAGHMNIPDGEIFSAPVLGSIEGAISINTPSLYEGFTFENIRLVFKGGYIAEATANDSARLNAILDRDRGARAVGEFALGVNPYITFPMKDTLFDEKIAGSFHFTPGCCYDECDNGNRSRIHWDMVCIQTPEYGGGEIWFDNTLVRRDGRFVPPALQALNPENLK